MKNNFKPEILVSIKEIDELNSVVNFSNIIDLKNPKDGAIGSWDLKKIHEIVKIYRGKLNLSATLGNIKSFQKLKKKLLIFDSIGLDYLKIGCFFDSIDEFSNFLKFLSNFNFKTKIVLVLFAENINLVSDLTRKMKILLDFNFKNLMLDTMDKSSNGLFMKLNTNFLKRFVSESKKINLRIGLAGKLEKHNIKQIAFIKPDIVGLRGALCEKSNRNSKICKIRAFKFFQLFDSEMIKAQAVAGACMEA